jgi:hypothetical protein
MNIESKLPPRRLQADLMRLALGLLLLAAPTMTGADGIRLYGLPGDRVVSILRKYNRMK